MFLHVLHLCFCKPCDDFCSCEGDNNRDGLKTSGVNTFTNFEFVGVAWAQVRTIISRASLIHGFVVFLFSLKKPFAMLDLRLSGYVINYFLLLLKKRFLRNFANYHFDLMTLSIFVHVTIINDISTQVLLVFDENRATWGLKIL